MCGATMLLKLPTPPQMPLCGVMPASLPIPGPVLCYASQKQLKELTTYRRKALRASLSKMALSVAAEERAVLDETDIDGMSHFLDSLKWDTNGLVAVIVQVSTPAHMAPCYISIILRHC